MEKEFHLHTIILHDQPNGGKTIIEKFEKFAEVDFAVAIWTKDDIGKLNNEKSDFQGRARQNVVFETGFFVGKLGREKVIILCDNNLEIPSDYSGILFIEFSNQWKHEFKKEIDNILGK